MTTSAAVIAEKSKPPPALLQQEPDAHVAQLLIDVRVVDDFADEIEGAIGKLEAGFIGVVHGPVYAVAEAELAGEPEGERPHRQPIVPAAQGLHHGAVVVHSKLALDFSLEPESAPVIGAVHGS